MEDQMTYEIVAEGKAIFCKICLRTSYHPEDVRHKYCAGCHQFHRLMAYTKAE